MTHHATDTTEAAWLVSDSETLPAPTRIMKRAADIVLAATGLVATSPLMLIAALLIKLDSHGPVLYRQERIGYHGRPFCILKLRSMVENAEPYGPQLSFRGDTRTTRIGRWMRRFHFDEVPQFVNVLRGEMSIVGPRPERECYASQILRLDPRFRKLLSVRPGMTSQGIISYGYASTVRAMTERMEYDLRYIDRLSAATDINVLFSTIATIFKGKGI